MTTMIMMMTLTMLVKTKIQTYNQLFEDPILYYIRANIHCASSIGHIRRKEVEAAKIKEEERKKSKSETMKPGQKYKSGSVPTVSDRS